MTTIDKHYISYNFYTEFYVFFNLDDKWYVKLDTNGKIAIGELPHTGHDRHSYITYSYIKALIHIQNTLNCQEYIKKDLIKQLNYEYIHLSTMKNRYKKWINSIMSKH